jgi:integrase
MPSIERRVRGDGTTVYRARVRLDGARPVAATFARLTDAKRWAEKTATEIRQGRYFRDELARQHTLAEAIDRYVAEVLPRKPRTAPFQARQLAWWRARLGHLRLIDLSASAIVGARAQLMREPGNNKRTRGPSTANRYMAVLSHVLSIAVREWEWLECNAARKLSKLREPRGREVFLSAEECERLLSACRAVDVRLHIVVLIALSTGMRRSEILRLRRDQVDFTRGYLYLDDTKNRERRGVPLVGPAREALRAWMDQLDSRLQLVFAGRTGRTPFDIRKLWYRARQDAGFPGVRIHDLRHSAASLLAKDGASLPEIGAILGHKSPAMTKRYAHFAASHLQEVVSRMNERFAR